MVQEYERNVDVSVINHNSAVLSVYEQKKYRAEELELASFELKVLEVKSFTQSVKQRSTNPLYSFKKSFIYKGFECHRNPRC